MSMTPFTMKCPYCNYSISVSDNNSQGASKHFYDIDDYDGLGSLYFQFWMVRCLNNKCNKPSILGELYKVEFDDISEYNLIYKFYLKKHPSSFDPPFDNTKWLISTDGTTSEIHGKNNEFDFIATKTIDELKNINNRNLDKLIDICCELNKSFYAKQWYSTLFLTRAILDYVPPIFSCNNFKEVANNYNGTKSFKKNMKKLDTELRNIADDMIHKQHTKSNTKLNRETINYSQQINYLLLEVIALLGNEKVE